ncbi:unnamed protein product [Notodromas monacha]|uniref:Uncharacterized protein n=1 Tax=Notodromas monacha TaxID=399045 RepID=A0A7R9BXN1_9CRUS|nr:unnamed protein product [Notodromas monacha]CAG0923253.1 unnamed protein product [Notodromas monacha]
MFFQTLVALHGPQNFRNGKKRDSSSLLGSKEKLVKDTDDQDNDAFCEGECGVDADVPLTRDEVMVIEGLLNLKEKNVGVAMVEFEDAFVLSLDAVLDFKTYDKIVKKGFSRIPVYDGTPQNIVKILLVKTLITVDPQDKISIRNLLRRADFHAVNPAFVQVDRPLSDVLNDFKAARAGHLSIVQKNDGSGEVSDSINSHWERGETGSLMESMEQERGESPLVHPEHPSTKRRFHRQASAGHIPHYAGRLQEFYMTDPESSGSEINPGSLNSVLSKDIPVVSEIHHHQQQQQDSMEAFRQNIAGHFCSDGERISADVIVHSSESGKNGSIGANSQRDQENGSRNGQVDDGERISADVIVHSSESGKNGSIGANSQRDQENGSRNGQVE